MNPDSGLKFMFLTSAEQAQDIFGFVLQEANEHDLFYPKLTKSSLFDLYETLMTQYTLLYGGPFKKEQVANNMERFFNVEKEIDSGLKDEIKELLQSNEHIIRQMNQNNISASVQIVPEGTDSGALLITVPVESNMIHDNLMVEDSVDGDTIELGDGLYQDRRVTPIGQQVKALDVFKDLMTQVTAQVDHEPDAYYDIYTRLRGATQMDIQLIHEQITVIIEALTASTLYQREPNWTEIIEFAYDYNGESLNILMEHVRNLHNLLTSGLIHTVPRHKALLMLQNHLVDIAHKGNLPEMKPLSRNSQLLLTFVDYIGAAMTANEEGDYFG